VTPATCVVLSVAAGLGGLRWLRVAQREHYLPGSVGRFALRWWTIDPLNVVLALAGVGAAVAAFIWPLAALLTAAVVAIGPIGLGLRGRTSTLAWTARLRRVAILVGVVLAAASAAGMIVSPGIAAVVAIALPVIVDLSLFALAPVERRLGSPWVEKAAQTLRSSGASVVAITGSYGKTSTKGYVAQLLAGRKQVLASPASFNNRMGLARAINEHLSGSVEVFVAEMGTYGPGEIAELCSWIPPDVAVITAIGPVHLERFGTEDRIVESKSEILEKAGVAVLNVDDPRLAALADREESARRVIRVGTTPGLDVSVTDGVLSVRSEPVGAIPETAHPTNVACAVGVLLALDVAPDRERVEKLTEPEHRRTITRGQSGVLIIDDTFNSNPEGARAALGALAAAEVTGRRVVVTPGMVELGSRQAEENRRFASEAARVADHLIVVGRTNRKALLAGAAEGNAEVTVVASREEAVEWVRSRLGPEDAVLYENDLPDHFP
jgi:UDP-N-acetylmuramoyl-tripeptide--D-alanyl-D-alanine ligase